jgi:hypothetical protein
VFYGGFFYVFGGKSNGYHNDLWQYHVYQNNWKMVKPISGQSKLFARFGQSAVLWQGALYVFGGYDQHGFCCDGLHAFQFARNAWFKELKTTGKARERYHHTAVVYGRCMYIFGGRSDNEALEDLLEYHFDARSWSVLTTTGTPPSKRWGHSAAVIGDRMFVFGGCDGTSCFGDLHEYDFGTRRWALVDVPHCPSPRYFQMMTVEGDKMYVVGGKDLWGRCLSENARVWTSQGFLGMRDLFARWTGTEFFGNVHFATYSVCEDAIEWQHASRFILNPAREEAMVRFESEDRLISLTVTGDHDILVHSKESGWTKVKARVLLSAGSVRMKVVRNDGRVESVAFRRPSCFVASGHTWCVTVPNGLIVARESEAASAVVTGNCFDEVHEFRQRGASSALSLTMQPLIGTPTPDSTKVRLKLHFNEEIRVLVVNKSFAFDELLGKLREQYDKTISFRYVDEEGDLITVRSEDDWQEALSFYIRTGLQTFKVFLDEGPKKASSNSGSTIRLGGSSRGSLRSSSLPADDASLESIPAVGIRMSPPPSIVPSNKAGGAAAIKWQLGEKIGSGAFGQVYKVLNAETGELFAMKQVKITQETNNNGNRQIRKAIESLMQEIELMQGLTHSNIVRYLGSEKRDDTLNIFMEFVSGGSIAGMLQKFSAFPEKVVASFTKQIVEGLRYLHERRIVHRDLKGEQKRCLFIFYFFLLI